MFIQLSGEGQRKTWVSSFTNLFSFMPQDFAGHIWFLRSPGHHIGFNAVNKCRYIDVYKISVKPVHKFTKPVSSAIVSAALIIAMYFSSFFHSSSARPIQSHQRTASVPREHIIYALCHGERRQTVHYTYHIVCRQVHTSKRTAHKHVDHIFMFK